MAEIKDNKGIKVIAYYLPQFHAIPENDKAWGAGFTEWTNVKKARPQYEGHYQPKVPLNNNYYNLLDDNVKVWQSDLAQKYGVWGFCYYHYWFKDGKLLLEKPAEQMLKNRTITIPFCFSWANENWTKRWDGGNDEIIAEQDYGNESDWEKHLQYLLPFFRDKRYITLNGDPIFIIYKPEEIPRVNDMIVYWNERIKEYGFSKICFMIQNPNWFFTPSYDMGYFSYQIKFLPFFSIGMKGKTIDSLKKRRTAYRILRALHFEKIASYAFQEIKKLKNKNENSAQKLLDYDEIWRIAITTAQNPSFIEGAFVDWDNTARKLNGYVITGSTPEKYGKYLEQLFQKIKKSGQEPVIFLNAWNEWCEGAYLEPDTMNKYRNLEETEKVIRKYK